MEPKTIYQLIMNTRSKPLLKPVLENQHLREWKNNAASEVQDFYTLRCKHALERDRLSFEPDTDSQQVADLVNHHKQEISELKERHAYIRAAIAERHRREIERLASVSY